MRNEITEQILCTKNAHQKPINPCDSSNRRISGTLDEVAAAKTEKQLRAPAAVAIAQVAGVQTKAGDEAETETKQKPRQKHRRQQMPRKLLQTCQNLRKQERIRTHD